MRPLSNAMAEVHKPNWLAIRTYYFSAPNITYEQCAEKFPVSTRSIESKGSKEGWVDERRRIFGQAQDELRDLAQSDAVRGLAKQAEAVDDYVETAMQLLLELRSDKKMKSIRSKADVLESIGKSLDRGIRLRREVSGLKPGDASSEDGEETEFVVRRTVVRDAENGQQTEAQGGV
jgi:hypothetical protein